MPINREFTQHTIDFLNSLLETDRQATTSLIEYHTPCNQELAKHPTIQVRGYGPNPPTVGLLGILNGLCGAYDSDGFGPITMQINDDGSIKKFGLTRPCEKPLP